MTILADRTVLSVGQYFCLSACQSKWYTVYSNLANVFEQVNSQWPYMNTILLLSTVYINPSPQSPHLLNHSRLVKNL